MRTLLLFLLVFSTPAWAAENFLGSAIKDIAYLQIDDRHAVSRVWSGRFEALNGDPYDVAHFYASKRPQFKMRAAFAIKQTPRLRLTVPLHYDHGYDAALYEATPYLGLGFIGQWAARDNVVLGLHIHDGLQSGGKVHERPCRDGFDRAFHCGSGLPWTDAQDFLQNRQIHPNGKITLHWRF